MRKRMSKVTSETATTKPPFEGKLKMLSNPPRSGRYSRAEGPARAGASKARRPSAIGTPSS